MVKSFRGEPAALEEYQTCVPSHDRANARYRNVVDTAREADVGSCGKQKLIIFAAVQGFFETRACGDWQRGIDAGADSGFATEPMKIEGQSIAQIQSC